MPVLPRALLTSGLLAALTIGAAACGSSGGSTSSADTSAAAAPAASTPAASTPAASTPAASSPAGATTRLSANDATAEELQTIPGVGPEIAKEILEYRPYDAQTGPDKFRDELAKYIDDTEIERILTYLDFGA
ncbi:MAG: helix-hairpin-helix domain-containing protein [Acidimicrobiales bacterium]